MSALIALVLAAADLTPPPPVEAPEPPAEVEAPESPAEGEADFSAQLTFATLSTANGVWVGLNTCALLGCFNSAGSGPALGGVLGAGAGIGLAYASWDLSGHWGRAALLDSGMMSAAIGSFFLASRRFWPSVELRYLVAAGLDVAGTAAVVALAHHVAPRPEAVWLADSLALWGVVVGNLLATFLPAPENDPANVIFGGAAAGGLAGAMLAASASRVSAFRFWAANGAAMLGGLLLGGSLFLVEQVRSGGFGFDRTIPAAGAAAGIAAGFLVGFVFSESL